MDAPQSEAIAIVGMGCRFPGNANSPKEFWRLLADGVDAVREIPADRWSRELYYSPEPGTPGKTNACRAGTIDKLDHFDAAFFGISPREAALMDPQQRLLLEVAWEALEDAGQRAEQLAGSDTGVFVGISSMDYAQVDPPYDALTRVDTYANTGGALSIAANRISYVLDLHGPSMAVDTACSSALVALHLACRSIRASECSLALVGGVNALITLKPFIGFSRLSMLSPDGCCKAFDKDANGFVRAEGAGVVVLKRLSSALRDGDRIYALIRGTSVNQDGHTSGLTVPGQEAQEEMLRSACRDAGIAPSDIQYVEAHGTGTQVGDPIEARALGNVLCQGRPEGSECLLGSVKTNIGHTESASGIAGLIKAALSLYHREVPPNLHFNEPNPQIPFGELKLRVPTAREPMPRNGRPSLAGVNSFGFGGTNSHAVLEEPPLEPSAQDNGDGEVVDGPRLVPLSARSVEALRQYAARCREHLTRTDNSHGCRWDDFCWTATRRRSHLEHRLAIVAGSREAFLASLEAFAGGETTPAAVSGRVVGHQRPKLAFVFSGQGPQWWAMGRELFQTEPVFRGMIEHCDELIRRLGGWSLVEELSRDETNTRMENTAIAQPAIFALQVSLARLWQSWGVEPDAVFGHSVGEIAAAYVSGALQLDEAVRVIFHRGRLMDLAQAHGKMLAVSIPADEANRWIQGKEDRISLAAVNSPGAVTLSGDGPTLETIAAELDRQNIFCRFLRVSYAFHSPQMECVRDALLKALEDIAPRHTALPMYSTVTASAVPGTELDADYWWRNVREAVQFGPTVGRVLEDGYGAFLEIAAHPVLSGYILECAPSGRAKPIVVHSLRRTEPEREAMLKSLGMLYTHGFSVDWSELPPRHGRFVPLPMYPWQHEKHWNESEDSRDSRTGAHGHVLLGRRFTTAVPTWRNTLDRRVQRYLNDHRVQGHMVVSATAYLEMAMAAAKDLFGSAACIVEEIDLAKACFLEENQSSLVQFVTKPDEATFSVYSRPDESNQPWTENVKGKLRPLGDLAPMGPVDLEEIRRRCPRETSADECYRLFQAFGLEYGPAYRGIERVWTGDGEALGRIRAPESVAGEVDTYLAHPALLDACLQVVVSLFPGAGEGEAGPRLYLPVEFRQVRRYAHAGATLWSHACLIERTGRDVIADIQVYSESGDLLVDLRGVRCQAVDAHASGRATADPSELVHEYQWQPKPRPGDAADGHAAAHFLLPSRIAEDTQREAEIMHFADRATGQWTRIAAAGTTLDGLCTRFILKAFADLGLELQPGMHLNLMGRAEAVIDPRFHPLFGRFLEILEEDGILARTGQQWTVLTVPEHADCHGLWRQMLAMNPAWYAELTLVERCGRELARILRGEIDPLQLIFPDGSLLVTEHLYQDAPFLRLYNRLVERAIGTIVGHLPEGQTIRVLEIGAGTGGLTSFVLPKLPARRTEYVFTDLSNHFFNKASEKFQDYRFVEYRRLDVESDPAEQGFDPHSFDVVLGSEVLHATADLRQTLTNVGRLLTPQGLLVLLEIVKPIRWVDLVFGTTEGWWRFTDRSLRPSYPLMPFARWKGLLEDVGFEDVREASGLDEQIVENAVILARRTYAGPMGDVDEPPSASGAEPDESATPSRRWVIVADQGGRSCSLAEQLGQYGDTCEIIERGVLDAASRRPEGLGQLLEELLADGRTTCAGVIHLGGLDVPVASRTDEQSLEESLSGGCMSVLRVTQALSAIESPVVPRLWLITQGAESVGSRPQETSVAQAALWGLGRVIGNEIPKLRTTLVDLSSEPGEEEIRSLAREIRLDDAEDEIALRGKTRYVHRFVQRTSRHEADRSASGSVEPPSFRLEVSRLGVMDQMTPRATQRRAPGAGQVEIQVAAAGLNFSDVMKALGLYPGLPDGPVPLGIECSGTICAVGEDVEGFQPGDEVFAVAPFSFGSFVTVGAGMVAHKPKSLTFEEAATIPVAFLTAWYALVHLAHVAPGERVLIHSATGGVGLAAIQIARNLGAEIYATAGTAEKRELLRALGIRHVMNSRALSFADEILEATGGEGVDVVLNSLSGEAIAKGLSILRDCGRFLEIGKRDIYQNSRVGLRPFRKNVSFFAIDLDRAMRQRPAAISTVFQELATEFREGRLTPLPHRVFPMVHVTSAFRYMAQAKHIGKVVVTLDAPDIAIAPSLDEDVTFREDATYLITGGLGGFGLTVARWMVDRGARHLVLLGRRGAHTPEAQAATEGMRQAGAAVLVAQCDVANAEQLASVLDEVDGTMPPLRGVMHAAMVLDDCIVPNLSEERMRKAWAPKVQGAWNLHTQTLGRPLDFFVLFSSMTSVFGTPGQANYASANAVLDSLAFYRRAQGLPAVSISWGYLAEVGFVAAHREIGERFEAMGVHSFTPREALEALSQFLLKPPIHAGVMRVNWQRFAQWFGTSVSSRFSELSRLDTLEDSRPSAAMGAALRETLLRAEPDDRGEIITDLLRRQVARVVGSSAEDLDADRPLTELGLDSLMGAELRNWIEGELQLSLPMVELMRGPTIAQLAETLAGRMSGNTIASPPAPAKVEAPPEAPTRIPVKEPLPPEVANLSEEEIDSMLTELLSQGERE